MDARASSSATAEVIAEDHPPVDIPRLRRERLARLRAELHRADCAGAIFFDPINIRYATDVSNMQVWCLHNPARYAFVATSGPVVMFEFPSCHHLAEQVDIVDEVRGARSWVYLMAGPLAEARTKQWATETADLVTSHGGGNRRLAVDRLDWMGYLALERVGVEVVDGQRLVEQARMVKTPEELRAMGDAMDGCERAVTALRERCAPGVSERELWSGLHQQNIALGGEWIETRLLASGPRTNPWYQECSDRIIRAGDLVALDTDLIGRHGYCCDISRTWRCGDDSPNDGQRRTYAVAHALLQRLLEHVGPGVSLGELSEHMGDPPDDYRVYSCLAHGVGLCDEYPVAFWKNQNERYDAVLEPHMTICVESYAGPVAGGEGVKLEEQVLVTESGVEVLSGLPLEVSWL
jgi:Xaa-Pro aminopeptidase